MSDPLRLVQTAFGTFHDGLEAVRAALDGPALQSGIARSVELMLSMKGRLIVTGMGKSGHIGSKLAATFSSTGTPAHFVHPAEANHGDLGMIRSDDVVLMLSWSGETHELGHLAAYTRRFQVPLILICGNARSSLARHADICLELPITREACPHNLAPTTSSLMQLAVGDALAVTLLQLKGFSESSYHRFHPGGKLGASLTAVREIMHGPDDLPLVPLDAPVIDVVAKQSERNFGIVGVLGNGGVLAGVITDGDIRRYLLSQLQNSMQGAMSETFARDIMTSGPICLEPERLAARALNVMQTRRISAAFVTENSKPVGLVTMIQLLNLGVA